MTIQITQRCAALIALAILSACQSVSLAEDGGSVPKSYDTSLSPSDHNFRYASASAGEPVRLGAVSERFELRDGDCDGGDCTTPRARAEIQLSSRDNPGRIGEDIWYGWSFYNDSVPSFTKKNALRLVFGQWTMGGGQRPIFRFIQLGKGEGDFSKCDPKICSETSSARGDLVVHLDDLASSNNWGDAQNDGYICRLFDLTEQRGKWVDLTVNTNFSTGSDGYLRIWVNGSLACYYSGPLVSASSAKVSAQPEHRRGIFSTWDKRWKQTMGDKPKPTLVVYYDEFRSGASRTDVDVLARQAKGYPPAN